MNTTSIPSGPTVAGLVEFHTPRSTPATMIGIMYER